MRQPEVREYVVYFDEYRRRCDALLTAVHGDYDEESGDVPCVNLIYVVHEQDKQDSYGRQTDHATSCVHASDQKDRAGCYWCFPEEVESSMPIEPLKSHT